MVLKMCTYISRKRLVCLEVSQNMAGECHVPVTKRVSVLVTLTDCLLTHSVALLVQPENLTGNLGFELFYLKLRLGTSPLADCRIGLALGIIQA